MMATGSSAASLAALLALAPLALAHMPATAADKPLVLAQVAPPPLPQPPSAQFFYSENGKPMGPFSLSEIQAKIAAGLIKPDTLVWKAGTPSWVAAKELAEVAVLFTAAPPTPAPKPAPTPSPTPVASGCTGKVLLADDFRQVDDSWGVESGSDAVTVEDGKVKVKVDPNGLSTLVYNGQLFDDADYCLTIQTPNNVKDTKDTDVLAGMIFWAQDDSNFYSLSIETHGLASIGRRVKGKWTHPVPWHAFSGVKPGAGAKNMLRLTTNGGSIIAYINGQKFASVKGQVPDGGGAVGLYAQAEKSSRDTWKFFDLKVTQHAQ
jgi:hypothetical protein